MSFVSLLSNLGSTLWQVLAPASCHNHSHDHCQTLRPHHVVLLCGVCKAISATGVVAKLSNMLQAWASNASESFIPLIQCGLVPDCIIRWGTRLQLRHHLHMLASSSCTDELECKKSIIQQPKTMLIAIETDAANEQHCEALAAFHDTCLGPHRKHSSGCWKSSAGIVSFEESK